MTTDAGLLIPPREVQSVLVINVSRIGDTLLTTPAVRAIANAYPRAGVTYLGHPKRVEILEHLPFIQHAGAITKNSALLRGRFPGARFDIAIVYGSDRPLIAYALRVAGKVVAFRQGDAALEDRLFRVVDEPAPQSRHAVLMRMALLEPLGIPGSGLYLSYEVTEDESAWARSALAAVHTPRPAPLIGLQIASFPTKGYRDWPLERFEALCARVLERWPGAHFLVFGGDLERDRAQALSGRFGRNATSYAGKLTLRQTAALMNTLDLYVGVDTGPTHIMGALRRPMVPLYHCHSPSWMLAPLEHPCCYPVDHPRAGGDCTTETPMAEITVDRVWAEVVEALAANPPQGNRAAA
jgi:heptosyltransferase III